MEEMSKCPQTETQSVLDHGNSVWGFTQRILNKDFEGMKIPEWFSDNFLYIIKNIHPMGVIEEYNILHDCGKPFCLEYDAAGKRHFPNHAAVSKSVYLELDDSRIEVGNLIGYDMVLHSSTAEEIQQIGLCREDAFTLLITAFAEIHSNASMFGGIDSISFKCKWKTLDKRGKMFLRLFDK